MARVIYALCAITSLVCTWLLLRGYMRTRARLLLWSGLCFAFLTLNNIVLYIDLEVVSSVDLSVIRAVPAVIALALLIYGLIWETR